MKPEDPPAAGAWLAVPEIMELTGAQFRTVKTWLQDRDLVAVRRGPNAALMVPEQFLTPHGPVPALHGTLSVLSDSGLADEEIVDWLLRPDDTLQGGSAIEALRAGHKTEVRRRAQEIAW